MDGETTIRGPMPQTRILIVDDSTTIRKVVQGILETRGYVCTTAADGVEGLERLAQTSDVDLILLDFVMPRMNGYKFCRALRAADKLKNIPVVLMSAKAEHIREQFIRQTGALDAITKPFDARALVAVVEASLRRTSSANAPEMAEDELEEIEVEDLLEEGPISEVPPRRSQLPSTTAQDVHRISERLSKLLSTQVDEILEQSTSLDDLSARIRSCVEEQNLQHIAENLSSLDESYFSDRVLLGNVKHIPLGEILQLLSMQQTSGTLVVSRGNRTVEISLSNGRIDLAQTKPGEPEFLLGRYLVDSQALTPETLEKAISDARDNGQLLGRWLLDAHIVNEQVLQTALVQQSSEIIYEVLRWRQGWFSLRRGELSSEAELAHLGLSVSSLILEGFRRVDEWRVIEESIHFDDVLYRDEAAIGSVEPADLSTAQRDLLKLVDGRRTVRDVIDESHQSAFDVCKTLYQLLQSRLVREFKETSR